MLVIFSSISFSSLFRLFLLYSYSLVLSWFREVSRAFHDFWALDNIFVMPGAADRTYYVNSRPISTLDYVMLSSPVSSHSVESRRGAQHAPVVFETPFDPVVPVDRMEVRLQNLFFTKFDVLRVQTFIKVEYRFLCGLANPDPEFIYSRLVTALHAQGRVNTQPFVEFDEEWMFFLSDFDRAQIKDLEAKEKEVFVSSRDGLGLFSDVEVREFYRGFNAQFSLWKKKASDKMWTMFRAKGGDRSQTWKLLKRIRGSSRAVPIEPGKLLEHFKGIFYDQSKPLAVQYPALHHCPVFGPFLKEDYNLTDSFTMEELDFALTNLNQAAGVGPGRVSAKWVVRIFSTDTAKEYLLFLFNQCFRWGVCPLAWSDSEFFVLYMGKGDVTDSNNYRAINLLDGFYRIYSRLLYKRLSSWAERYNYFNPTQFGFRSGSGTNEAVFSLQTLVKSWLIRHGKPVFCVFVDIKKAFPSVDRSMLIDLLHKLGLPGPMVKAISSSFHLNTCRLKIEGHLSERFPVNLGVREGDIESPPLFNLVYGEVLRSCDLDFFPDDAFEAQGPIWSMPSSRCEKAGDIGVTSTV